MKKSLLLGALLLAGASSLHAQQFKWAKQIDDGYFFALHSYMEGSFWATGFNTLARRYADDGTQLKSVAVTGANFSGHSITTDAAGNVYVTGRFNNPLTVDGKALQPYGLGDMFVAKMDPDGNHVEWIERAGSDAYDAGTDIIADHDGNTLVAGVYSDTAAFGGQTLISKGQFDLFLARYDAGGKRLWVKSSGGQYDEPSCGLLRTTQGKVYYYGRYTKSAKLGEISAPTMGGMVSFILEVDPEDGSFSNLQTFPNIDIDKLKEDGQGNLIAGGTFLGSINLGGQSYEGTGELIFFKLNSAQSQSVQWVKIYGATKLADMAVAPDGSVYFCGSFLKTLRISDSKSLVSAGESDAYFAALNNKGEMVWAEQAGASLQDNATTLTLNPWGTRLFAGGNIRTGPITFGDYSLAGHTRGVAYLTELKTLTTGIKENPASVQIKVFPNPSKGNITLQAPSGNGIFRNISLRDLSGRIVWGTASAPASARLALPALPAGMYILQAEYEGGMVREKVMIGE